MKLGIASDHQGYKMKEKLIKYLEKKGHTINDYGTNTIESTDYPDYAFKVGEEVKDNNIDLGILICKTGIGMSIACNKVGGVRCAKVDNVLEAKMSRLHNNANVIAIPGNINMFRAKDIIDAFLKTEFSNIERHQKRVSKIDNYNK